MASESPCTRWFRLGIRRLEAAALIPPPHPSELHAAPLAAEAARLLLPHQAWVAPARLSFSHVILRVLCLVYSPETLLTAAVLVCGCRIRPAHKMSPKGLPVSREG